jgi:pimeloyl-ACP methyl ester carboxylesterase
VGVALAAAVPATALLPPARTAGAAERAPAATAAVPVPARFEDQQIVWLTCLDPALYPGLPRDFYRLQCGSFVAPADWSHPDDGASVTIAVSRLPAGERPARGVTFTNPGGPGEPGLELPLVFSQARRTALLRTQDVYGVDVRGTGASTNVTCGGPMLQSLLDPRDRRPANLGLIMDAADLAARFCAGAPGLPIARVTTANAVRDLDLLRRLVRAPEVNWIGYSAGTWLGAQYADAFPGTAGRFVFDSTTDVTGTWQDAFELQPLGFERRLRRDFMRWVARHDPEFGLGTTPGAVLAGYESIRARLTPQAPVDSAVLLDLLMAGAMYSSDSFVDAALLLADHDAFLDAQHSGDLRGAARARARVVAHPLLARSRQVGRQPLATDAVDAAFLAYTCNDTPWQESRQQLVDRSGDLGARYPLLGAGTLNEPCAFWRVSTPHLAPPDGTRVPPVLVVQSGHDPATPLEGARRTVGALSGSRLLMVTGEGDHGLYAGGNACVDAAVERWIVDGRLPAPGTTCRGKGLPDPRAEGLQVRAQGLAAPPRNPLASLDRIRAAVRAGLTCRTGAAAGC